MPSFFNEYKTFSVRKRDKPSNSEKTFSFYWSFQQTYFEVCQKPRLISSEPKNTASRLYSANFGQQIQNRFSRKARQTLNSAKTFSLYWIFLKFCFEVCQMPRLNLLRHGILVQGFTMSTLVNEYKTISLGKGDKPSNSAKIFSLYWIFPKFHFELCQKLRLNLLHHGILVQGFTMPPLVNEYKTIFLGKLGKP